MLLEKVANEMDPNLIIIRLGDSLEKQKLLEKSAPISSVKDQDMFAVSFRRANFEKKRDAQAFSKLNRDTKQEFFVTFESQLEKEQAAFNTKFEEVFFKG